MARLILTSATGDLADSEQALFDQEGARWDTFVDQASEFVPERPRPSDCNGGKHSAEDMNDDDDHRRDESESVAASKAAVAPQCGALNDR